MKLEIKGLDHWVRIFISAVLSDMTQVQYSSDVTLHLQAVYS